MRGIRMAAATLAVGVGCAAASAEIFTFDAGIQGWAVFDINYLGQFIQNPTPVTSPVFDAANGLPPGSVRAEDVASETWIGAPASSLGDRSELVGSAISFDIYYRTHDNATYAAVGLAGPNFSIFVSMPAPALNEWLHWSFALVAGQWQVNSIGGPVATQGQILEVLTDLRGVFIHTEWTTGTDDTNVDNIRLGTACPGDTDGDGDVDFVDLNRALSSFGASVGNPNFIAGADLDGDGDVDFVDLNIVLSFFGTAC